MTLPTQTEVRPILLKVLFELSGRARPRDVYPRVTAAFPDITPEDLLVVLADGRTNRWRNRIQWARQDLVLADIIDRSERGWWKLTQHGAILAERGASAGDLAPGTPQPKSPEPSADVASRSDSVACVGDDAPPMEVVASQPERLQQELAAAAVQSQDPDRFERAVGSALSFLGYEVDVIGGAGRTDVLAVAPLGINRYTVVVDAKSSSRGRVSDAHIDWLSIRSHKTAERADFSCVVGPDFASGQLRKRAIEFDTTLLTTSELSGLVKVHAETPLVLTELRPVFESVPLARAVLPQIRAAALDRGRHAHLLSRLVQHIDNLNRAQPDVILAKPKTLLTAVIAQGDPEAAGVTLDDVRKALALLETVGVLQIVNGDGYASQTTVSGARQLLSAFATHAQGSEPGEGELASLPRRRAE